MPFGITGLERVNVASLKLDNQKLLGSLPAAANDIKIENKK
jgi:hypothetical protein